MDTGPSLPLIAGTWTAFGTSERVGLFVGELWGDGSSGEESGRGQGDRGVQQQGGQAGRDVGEWGEFDRVEGLTSDGVVEGDPEGDADGAREQAGGQVCDEERGDRTSPARSRRDSVTYTCPGLSTSPTGPNPDARRWRSS